MQQQQHSARSRPLQKNEWSKNKGGVGGGGGQAPPLNPSLQQQVYSVLPFLYIVLPTEYK